MVSIIIPAYNAEKYIAETLDSVLKTEYSPLEVIVIDDGSTDDTPDILDRYAKRDNRIRIITQKNMGVCHARNNAIREARGTYILPVDADNLIEPSFVPEAVSILKARPDVKVVQPRADFFGEKSGEWHLPPFSLRLLARRNLIDTCAMYRKADWEQTGGYCPEIIAREDWEFFTNLLKNGGKVVRLPEIVLHYRVLKDGKRVRDRKLKRHVVATMNCRHAEFYERMLGGRLHTQRSWSRVFNALYRLLHPRRLRIAEGYERHEYFVKALPRLFRMGCGEVIFHNRNVIRLFKIPETNEEFVVKEFKVPRFINRLVYGTFRSSKAQRSYEYADMLRNAGIGSPAPVAWLTERRGLLFTRSYYASVRSNLRYTWDDVINRRLPADQEEKALIHLGKITAQLHNQGWIHRDYSRGNILFDFDDAGNVLMEIIDLNRIRFKDISLEEGLDNLFSRLPMEEEQCAIARKEYIAARNKK